MERWKEEMPTEQEMLPKDKYTIFDRKEKKYRKGIHSVSSQGLPLYSSACMLIVIQSYQSGRGYRNESTLPGIERFAVLGGRMYHTIVVEVCMGGVIESTYTIKRINGITRLSYLACQSWDLCSYIIRNHRYKLFLKPQTPRNAP